MEQILKMILGITIIAFIIAIAIYIAEVIFLNKFNKLVYGKGTVLAWIPFYCQSYLLGKLAFNKTVGWILVALDFVSSKVSLLGMDVTLIKDEKTRGVVGTIRTIIFIGILIYAIYKYFQLKKQVGGVIPGASQQTAPQNAVPNGAMNQTNPFANPSPVPNMTPNQNMNQVPNMGLNQTDPFANQVNGVQQMNGVQPTNVASTNIAPTNPVPAQTTSSVDPGATIESIIHHAPDASQINSTPTNDVVPTAEPLASQPPTNNVVPTVETLTTPIPPTPVVDQNIIPVDTNNSNNM